MLQGVLVQKMMMEPYALSPTFFSERMKGIDADTSAAIFEELKGVGVVLDDNQSHFGLYETWSAFAILHSTPILKCPQQLQIVLTLYHRSLAL